MLGKICWKNDEEKYLFFKEACQFWELNPVTWTLIVENIPKWVIKQMACKLLEKYSKSK